MWLKINTYYIWNVFIIYLSNWQNFKNIVYQFLIKHTHTPKGIYTYAHPPRHTCPLFCFSFMSVCVTFHIFLIFHGIRFSMAFTTMIVTLLSTFFSFFRIDSADAMNPLCPSPHLLHPPRTIGNWLHCPHLWLKCNKSCYISSSAWFSLLLKWYTFSFPLKNFK